MNLFILDSDLKKSARMHCDKHIVKMPLELTQMLYNNENIQNTAHLIRKKLCLPVYRPTHENHPVSKWVTSDARNWIFTLNYALVLCDEYKLRYVREHKCVQNLQDLTQALFAVNHDDPDCIKAPENYVFVGSTQFYMTSGFSSYEDSDINEVILWYRRYMNFKYANSPTTFKWTPPSTKPDWMDPTK